MIFHVGTYPLHGHFLLGNSAFIDEQSAYTPVWSSVVAIIINVQHGAVFQQHPPRPLDMKEEKVDSIRDPKQLTSFLAKTPPAVNIFPWIVGYYGLIDISADDMFTSVSWIKQAQANAYQIVRLPVDRVWTTLRPLHASFKGRFVVSGKQDTSVPISSNRLVNQEWRLNSFSDLVIR